MTLTFLGFVTLVDVMTLTFVALVDGKTGFVTLATFLGFFVTCTTVLAVTYLDDNFLAMPIVASPPAPSLKLIKNI